jgi:cell division septation protein DedD
VLKLDIPVPKPATPPKNPAETPKPAGGAAQLGAFSSEAKADAAWAGLAAKGMLGGYQKRVIRFDAGDKTLWRLRASGGDAAVLCSKLRAGGDACSVVE